MAFDESAVAVCLLLMVFSATAGNEGCFERIAVGRRISADKVIVANVSAATTLTLCKHACQQRGPLCGSFAFGIGNQLEATCDLGAVIWSHVPPAVRIHSTSTVKLTADNSSDTPQTSTTTTPPTTQNGTIEEAKEEPDSIPGEVDVDFDLYVRRPSSVCERSAVGESTGILRPLPSPSSPPVPPPPSPSAPDRPSQPPPPPSPSAPARPSQPPPPSPSPFRPSAPPSPPAPSHHPPATSSPSRGAPWSQRYPPPSVHLKPPPLFQPSLPPIRSNPTPSPTYLPPPPSFHHYGPPHRSGHPWPQPPHFSDCFRRVGMGRLLPDNFVHRTVPSVGLEQCRVACTTEEHFRCEGFVYRWEESLCQLTAVPLSSLEFRHLGENDRVEYFTRDGRGPCPSQPQGPPWRPPPTSFPHDHGAHQMPSSSLPGFYGAVRPDPPVEQTVREEGFSWSGASHFPHSSDRFPAADSSAGMWQKQHRPWSQETECFVLVKRGFRLTADGQAHAASGDEAHQSNDVLFVSMRVRGRGPEECAKECFQSRLFHCAAFSYRFNGDPRTQGLSNCDLSGQPLQKLDPYQDLMQDRDYDVYGRTRGRACGDDSIMMASLDFPLQNAFPPSRTPPSTSPPPPPSLPPYLDNSLGPGSSWSSDVKEQGSDVTVGGLPCAPGTSCTRHPDGGFWGCPVAKGQGGKAIRKDWDYCCRPGHQCGYSEGYHLPWCYVGSADRDQWRPCSQLPGASNATKGDHGITNSYAYLHSASKDPVHKDTVSTKPSTSEEVKDSVIQKVYDVLKSGMVNESVKGEGNALETVDKRSGVREQKGNRTFGRRADQARYFRTSPHHHHSLGKH